MTSLYYFKIIDNKGIWPHFFYPLKQNSIGVNRGQDLNISGPIS